jgi:hypothetical protein
VDRSVRRVDRLTVRMKPGNTDFLSFRTGIAAEWDELKLNL